MLLTGVVKNFFNFLKNFLWKYVGDCGELCTFEAQFQKSL